MKRVVRADTSVDDSFDNWLKEMYSHRGFRQVDALCKRAGYELARLYYERYPSGKRYLDIGIRPVEKYRSAIYYNRRLNQFSAQTTAYGALNAEEYIEFRNAVDKIQALLTALQDFDFESADILEMSVED